MNNVVSSPPSPVSSLSSVRSAVMPPGLSPEAFARALTILESGRYRKILPSDFIRSIANNHKSNGISVFITENDRFSYWVQRSILKLDQQSQRSESMKFFI